MKELSIKVGDRIIVSWKTDEKNELGQNIATVLAIFPYSGRCSFFTHTIRFSCNTKTKSFVDIPVIAK